MVLFSSNAFGAILDDSTVVVLAQWDKKEKHTFIYSRLDYEILGADTILNSNISREFVIEVDDSTQHLYSLKYSRKNLPSKGDSIVLDEVPLMLMTNHNGALIKVLNWDSYLAWRNNDVENTSDDLMPYVSMLSFNGKRLRLNYDYRGSQIIPGHEVGGVDSVKSSSHMIITRDFINSGEYGLLTINTITEYFSLKGNSTLPLVDKFTQIVDSEKGWPMATYSERRRKTSKGVNVSAWSIKLLN